MTSETPRPAPSRMTDEEVAARWLYAEDDCGIWLDDPGPHSGDCTKECHTCRRCLQDQYAKKAGKFLAELRRHRSAPSPSSEVTAVVKEWECHRMESSVRTGAIGDRMAAHLTEQAKRIENLERQAKVLRAEVSKLFDMSVDNFNRATTAEAALETARGVLRKIAILEVHRPAHGGDTVRVGWCCEVCGCDAEMPMIGGTCCSPDDIPHALDCPLAALPSPTPAQKGETK